MAPHKKTNCNPCMEYSGTAQPWSLPGFLLRSAQPALAVVQFSRKVAQGGRLILQPLLLCGLALCLGSG